MRFAEEQSHTDVGTSTLQFGNESIGGSASCANVIYDDYTFAVEELRVNDYVVIDDSITMQMQLGAMADNLNVLKSVLCAAQRADEVREPLVATDVRVLAAGWHASDDRVSQVGASECFHHFVCSPRGCIPSTILEIKDAS